MAIKLVCFVLGLSLIFFVIFSYEDEERGLLRWLESKWLYLDGEEKSVSKWMNTALVKLARVTDQLLSRAYGEKLLSFKAINTPICITTGLAIGAAGLVILAGDDWELLHFSAMAVAIAIALIFICAPFTRIRYLAETLAALAVSVCAIITLVTVLSPYDARGDEVIDFLFLLARYAVLISVCLLLAFVIDFLAIALIRNLFRVAATGDTLRKTFAIILCATFVAPGLVYGGYKAMNLVQPFFQRQLESEFLFILGYLNLVTLLTSFFFLAVSIGALATRIFYAVAPRALYSVIKLKIVENRKAMIGIGGMLIGVMFPSLAAALKDWLKPIFG